jgi:hypothetical protein
MKSNEPHNGDTLTVDFPAFCVASPDTARRRLSALAARWAARYKESGNFPEFELIAVAAGSLVFTESAMDLGGKPGVRIYLVPELLSAVQQAMGWANFGEIESVFEAMVGRSCWGVLALVAGRRRPHTLSSLRAYIEALQPCWSSLDALRYVGAPPESIPLSLLIERRFAGLLAMWLRQPTGDPMKDLMSALESLEAATAETRLERAVDRLAQLASANQRVRNKTVLANPSFLRQKLIAVKSGEREAIEFGNNSDALTLLYAIDRELSRTDAT